MCTIDWSALDHMGAGSVLGISDCATALRTSNLGLPG